MMTHAQMLEFVRRLYADVGGDPATLVRVVPLYGGWYNALKFEVIRADNAKATIWRKDMDAKDHEAVRNCLRAFSGSP